MLRRIERSLLPRAFVDLHFHRLQRRAVVQHEAEDLMRVALLPHARDRRFQMDPRDLGLHPLRARVGILTRAADADDRPVPAGLVVAEIAVFLQVNLGEPFHVGNAVPARHDQA